MAGGMDLGTSSSGGKKALDATINLVPFIDLMAVTICFLIMTAVWTQVGRLQVAQAPGGSSDEAREASLPVKLLITGQALQLTVGGAASEPMPFVRDARGRLDLARLQRKLEELKAGKPDQQAITLQAEDAVRYDDLVRVIDGCLGAGLGSVQVEPVSG